jgi:hypothetical protein
MTPNPQYYGTGFLGDYCVSDLDCASSMFRLLLHPNVASDQKLTKLIRLHLSLRHLFVAQHSKPYATLYNRRRGRRGSSSHTCCCWCLHFLPLSTTVTTTSAKLECSWTKLNGTHNNHKSILRTSTTSTSTVSSTTSTFTVSRTTARAMEWRGPRRVTPVCYQIPSHNNRFAL